MVIGARHAGGLFPLQRVTNQKFMNFNDCSELQINDNNISKAVIDSELRSGECLDKVVVI